jgi:hypothetical protein
MDLMAFLENSSIVNYAEGDSGAMENWYSYFNWGNPPNTLALVAKVVPGTDPTTGQEYPKVVEEPTVYIGAPTSAEILSIAPNAGATAPWVQVAGAAGTAVATISGLGAVSGSSSQYITNTGTVQCSGKDVVVNGTLLLNHLNIVAESGGCRLYVTGAVFVEGPITYVSSGATADPTQNVQISSAEAIVLGVGLSGSSYQSGDPGELDEPESGANPLHIRLIDDARGPEFRSAASPSAYSTWASGVYAEATNIGSTLLVDASDLNGAPATAMSDAGQQRVSINYEHLLLNAPSIHSRYLGTTSGVIIAEVAEFSLGQFSFAYDSVFSNSQVPILPALPNDVLCAVASGGSCNAP